MHEIRSLFALGAGLGLMPTAHAHVEYYDLNQGVQVADLTATGKAASTAQYGENPVVAGLPLLNTASDRPLNDPSAWHAGNQVTTGVGTFTNLDYTPEHSSANVFVNDVTDFGWGNGTHATLGDSHKVDFFNFRLAVASTVTVSWLVDDEVGDFIDGSFSLYRGTLAYQGHDDSLDPLKPTAGLPPKRIQDPLDTGLVADAQGIASAFRDTTTGAPVYDGQFNALGNWGQANGAGNWSNVEFLVAVNDKHDTNGFSADPTDTLEMLTIELLPGNYTIAASGALGAVGFGPTADSFGITNLRGVLTFDAAAPAPVPLPPGALLLLSGVAWVGRRRSALRTR